MEGFQGPTNPNFFGEHLNVVESLEQGGRALDFSYGSFVNTESLRVEEGVVHQQHHFSIPSSRDKMPFLQMLQSVESPPFSPFTDPHFQVLLTSQQQSKLCKRKHLSEVELESCITHDVSESHSPVKSETKQQHCPNSCPEVASSVCNREPIKSQQEEEEEEKSRDGISGLSMSWVQNQSGPKRTAELSKSPTNGLRERRKRKRTRPSKNREEVENQRMTHIAVERNRRKQMNDHLIALRSLMPTSFIQRGDQASIIGGAIDFVKELEQLLQSLEAQKRMRKCKQEEHESSSTSCSCSCSYSSSIIPFNGFFTSPQYTTYSSLLVLNVDDYDDNNNNNNMAEKKSAVADIEVIVIQTHVNLKILSPRRPGQLLRAIAALEDIRLTILHLNITSFQHSVLYSFNLKIEDNCKLESADEIAAAVHQIFSYINCN